MLKAHSLPSRLYAILDVELTRSRGFDPLDVAGIWLDAGVRLIQVRAKTLTGQAWLDLVDPIMTRARAAKATVIVNDRADIARMADVDGVHVGQDDLSPSEVRALLGDSRIVGLSTHTPAQVESACYEPVTYIAIGPVFATRTKAVSADDLVGLEGVRLAGEQAATAGLPIVAIGGITLATASQVIAAGAASVAVISDLLSGDVARRCREYLQALDV